MGVAHTPISQDDFRSRLNRDIHEFATVTVDDQLWQQFEQRLHYLSGEFQNARTYQQLQELLAQVDQLRNQSINCKQTITQISVMSLMNSSKSPKISLLLADVDGTLVTKEKILTDRTRAAVHQLWDAGIRFTITSGRPPLGMKMIVDALKLTEPIAAFNGGLFVHPDFSTLEENVLPTTITQDVIKMIADHHLDIWIYRGKDWFVHERHGPHVDREEWTVKFSPTVVSSFDGLLDNVVKIVGVSDALDAVAKCEADVQQAFSPQLHCQAGASSGGGEQVSAARSQPYYLDVTHPHANKGAVVDRLSQLLRIPREEIATIGDMPNDVPMFKRSGLSIAMGNASAEVQKKAQYVTTSYEEEGFANAVEQFILGSNATDIPKSRLRSTV